MFNFGDNVDGDKLATKSKVDNFLDFGFVVSVYRPLEKLALAEIPM